MVPDNLEFMSIGSNCIFIACFEKEKRLKGPVDNVSLKSVNGLKLLIENKLYDFVHDIKPQKRKKNPNEFKKGDCEIETIYPNKTLSFIHNIPEGDSFFKNFKQRCDNLNAFIDKVRKNDNCWLIFSLNGNFVKYHTGELIETNLAEVLQYLNDVELLNKTIIIGSRVHTSTYKVFDHHLNKYTFLQIKSHFPKLNYIELTDVNAWEPENTIKQFNQKIPNFIQAIMARKDK